MSRFKVGDIVVRSGGGGKPRHWKISKVGRKYAYLEGDGNNYPYDLETGLQSDPHSRQFTQFRAVLYTLDEWAAKVRLDSVKQGIAFHGIQFGNFGRAVDKFSVEKLEKLLAVLDEDI